MTFMVIHKPPETCLHRYLHALIKQNNLLRPLLNKLSILVKKALNLSEDVIIASDHGFVDSDIYDWD